MNVLVTGGAGYIGSHTAHQLTAAGHNVIVLDNLYSGNSAAIPSTATFVKGDISDSELVKSILLQHKIDCVMHFAAHIVVPESVYDPLKYYLNNTFGFTKLLNACGESGVHKLILSSTAAVYGEPIKLPVTEDQETVPLNPYGMSKLMCELILRDFATSRSNNFRYVTLRYFNVAGASSSGRIGQSTPRATHLIKVAAQAALGCRPHFELYGVDYPTADGTCVRDFIHVEDLATAHLKALAYLNSGGQSNIFNCGYGCGFSVNDVIQMMRAVSGSNFKVQKLGRRAGDPASLIANSQKIRDTLEWKPQFDDLEIICRSAFNWEKSLADSTGNSPNP